ncbi:hypothetical protein M409DRAFT_23030 [Zasmidium cellare ATCC 36951]|uniref:Zn(2)-C6 fungal-type domain-containing protein n=1 Tax=Zasmidium cellare ATCC 36951 TaxID=1080233 RepID=A0A6A6CNE7_ZASCE|nr:uncharacterized protein M409DRAFT_23030 [Zasmidium cellare ATCC 36951]KAF2166986.1 hypothetical protein M409DRAFT_23030 [Zasmidium cellare ATCC 36951]
MDTSPAPRASASEQEPTRDRPACDNCKTRKTKCDRGSPCSSCVTAKTQCRVTRKAPEKRQRVLLSKQYDEAMQNVSRQLGELQIEMRQLVENSKTSHVNGPSPAAAPQDSPSTHISGDHPDVSAVFEGYKGDSSFNAHVKHVADTLEGTFGANTDDRVPSMPSAIVHDLLQDVDATQRVAPESVDFSRTNLTPRYPELEDLPLAPTQPVLKLLRLAQNEKQRFFADVPFVDEQEFVESCKSVYFATQPYSLWTWIIVNIGLLYLFLDLDNKHYAQVGGVFCTKTGRSTIAWRLVSAAARMCLDLGLHRMPSHLQGHEASKKRVLFWHVYAFDKGMAFTNGRTPTIHHYDVAADRPDFQAEYPGIPGLMYAAFIEWTAVAGEIHLQLFSISAQQQPLSVRVERAQSFASRILQMQKALRTSEHGDPEQGELTFQGGLRILDIMAYGYLTIVYRIIPPFQQKPHPLQCCDECVDAARKSLTALVQVGERVMRKKPIWWSLFLNMTVSIVPFVSFIVIVGHTIATSSANDLALLSSVVSAIKPAVEHTPATQKLYNICQKFYQIADLIVSKQSQPTRSVAKDVGFGIAEGDLPMLDQDWDTCDALAQAGLADRLLLPTDTAYQAQIDTWWALNSRLHPWCLFIPRNAQEVASGLQALQRSYTGAGDGHIAVRSGGHNSAGASNIENGITIDLSLMNASTFDKASNVAMIQTGARWRKVYTDLLAWNVTVPGGRDGGVGVGGFLLGGGLTFFMGRRGFACDSVRNYEVVLANGTITNANATHNVDLWKALKGGGSNFGIVTRFDVDPLPAKDLSYSSRSMTIDHSDEVLRSLHDFVNLDETSSANDALVVYYTFNSTVSADIIISTIAVNTMGDANSTALRRIKSIPAVSSADEFESMASSASNSELPGGTRQSRNAGITLTFKPSIPLMQLCVDLNNAYVETLSHIVGRENFSTFMFLQPLPNYYSTISKHEGHENMITDGLAGENAIIWTGGVALDPDTNPSMVAIAHQYMSAMAAQIQQFAVKTGVDLDLIYMNYADATQDALSSYGMRNVHFMKSVARRYDPEGFFQHGVPRGFKLSATTDG